MKIVNIATNQAEVILQNARILVSYETPVAAVIDGVSYRTEKKWSNTTAKHITQWGAKFGTPKPQAFFDELLKVAA